MKTSKDGGSSEKKVKVGFLAPNKNNQEEDDSISSIPVYEGVHFVGRNDLSVTDKRVSRKHIRLHASNDGFVEVFVEGPNPIIINSRGQRRKICSQNKVSLVHGDMLELIPGSFHFKYISLASEKNPSSSKEGSFSTEGKKFIKEDVLSLKRKRQTVEDEVVIQSIQDGKINNDGSKLSSKYDNSLPHLETDVASCDNLEAIRHSNVRQDRLSFTFRLMKVKGLPAWANTSSVSIDDVIQGNMLLAVLSNYMVDMDWLLSGFGM